MTTPDPLAPLATEAGRLVADLPTPVRADVDALVEKVVAVETPMLERLVGDEAHHVLGPAAALIDPTLRADVRSEVSQLESELLNPGKAS